MNAQPTRPNPAKQARNRIIAALQGQQRTIARQDAEIQTLKGAVFALASAAGVSSHPRFAGLAPRRADSGQNPDGSPATTTEEAKQPQATDDPTSVGAAPAGANESVTPDAVSGVEEVDVVIAPPVLDNLQDVNQPVAGTDGIPANDNTIPIEVRVTEPSTETFDGPAFTSAAKREDTQARFMSSVRLARLQIAAGLASGEDFVVGQEIQASRMTIGEIDAAAQALASVARQSQPSRQATRGLVPRPAQGAGVQRAPSLQGQASVTGSAPGEDEFMFGDGDIE